MSTSTVSARLKYRRNVDLPLPMFPSTNTYK